jgi:hypothetical protein
MWQEGGRGIRILLGGRQEVETCLRCPRSLQCHNSTRWASNLEEQGQHRGGRASNLKKSCRVRGYTDTGVRGRKTRAH